MKTVLAILAIVLCSTACAQDADVYALSKPGDEYQLALKWERCNGEESYMRVITGYTRAGTFAGDLGCWRDASTDKPGFIYVRLRDGRTGYLVMSMFTLATGASFRFSDNRDISRLVMEWRMFQVQCDVPVATSGLYLHDRACLKRDDAARKLIEAGYTYNAAVGQWVAQ